MSKVLIVDDEVCCRILLEQMLDYYDADITVKSTSTGLEALSIINTDTPDLVFIDLQMPILDGEKLCAMIRKNNKLKNTKIVVTTGMLLYSVKNADHVLNKPFMMKDIFKVCDSYLKKPNIKVGKLAFK